MTWLKRVEKLQHALQHRLLALLLGGYVLAVVAPHAGLAMRGVTIGTVHWPSGAPVPITVPLLMLALLLFDAALGTQLADARALLARPRLVFAGVAANVVVPVAFSLVLVLVLARWHDRDEVQNVLVGLALIGAMPIAGSSAAWSQNLEGNLALSLALVLASTLLSPLLTPLVFGAIGLVTRGDYSEDLHELARTGGSGFVVLSIVLPSLLGLVSRRLIGGPRVDRWLPLVKLVNLVDLVLLNYSNASVALPAAARLPDWDSLGLTLLVTSVLCAVAFSLGWVLPAMARARAPERVAMMFGLGMNNNGAGLVLVSMALADHPRVALPVVFYNLVQQVAAGVATWLVARRTRGAGTA